jgi:hypothetical protein
MKAINGNGIINSRSALFVIMINFRDTQKTIGLKIQFIISKPKINFWTGDNIK